MRAERQASRGPPGAAAPDRAAPAARRPAALSPAGLQSRFGNQGAQAVLRAVVARAPSLPSRAEPAAPAAAPPGPAAPALSPAGQGPVPVQAADAEPAAAAAPPAPEAAAAATAPEAAAPAKPEAAVPGAPPAPGPAAAPAAEAAAATPAEAIAPVAAKVRKRAGAARTHAPAETAAAKAQAAAIDPATEKSRGAAHGTMIAIDSAETKPVDRQSFKEQLREALRKAVPTPKSEAEAERLKKQGAGDASAALSGQLGAETKAASAGLESAAQPGAEIPASEVPSASAAELVPEAEGSAPAPVAPGPAVPPPRPPPDYSEDRGETDRAMAEAGVTKEQMADSNEPEFDATLKAREGAEQQEAERVQRFGAEEGGILGKQEGSTGAMLAGGLGAIHGARGGGLGLVKDKQVATKTKEAAERARITAEIERIKTTTRDDVVRMLGDMETSANLVFGAGLKRAETAYEDTFEEEKGGALSWLGGQITGSWDETVEAAFRKAREVYDRIVSETIDTVADLVETRLALAKARVQQGRREVDAFVAGLDKSVRAYGEEARANIGADFDEMEGEIDAKRDAIVSSLADQYRESQKRVSALEEKLREENKSIWQKIYDATVGVIKKILAFKDFLLSVLAKVAQVVGAIISAPIKFLGNLIGGITTGLDNFMSRIGEHLKKGLLGWLFGALEGAGITIPDTFDLKGILNLVMQILGLTWANIRQRAVKVLGEPTVAFLEKSWEVFQTLIREGPAGVWQMLVEKIGDIKETILTEVGEWVAEKIITAGIKWVLSLLNPVAAFIKACMAIYDIVKFFIERAAQIAALINAIMDSLGQVVSGNVAGMAKSIEDALAKMIPVAIGFLASLLGLGGISEKIRGVIEKLRKPINAAIDWIIGKAAGMVKKVGGALFGGKADKKAERKADKKEDLDPKTAAQVRAAIAELHRVEAGKGGDGLSRDEAEASAQQVRKANPIIKAITVKPGKGSWVYVLTVNPTIEEESDEPAFPFTAAQIEEAKADAMEIVRRHKRYKKRQRRAVSRMGDPTRLILPTLGTAGVVGDLEQTEFKKERFGLGFKQTRVVEMGRGTEEQPVVVSQERLKSKNPDKPNIFVEPQGASHLYEVAERKLAEKAREYGLKQGDFMDALSHYRRRGQLPAAIVARLTPEQAADLRNRIANLLLIALHAESFRLGHAQATAAVSLATMQNVAAQNREKEVTQDLVSTLGSKTAHGGKGGAPAGRRSEAIAGGDTEDVAAAKSKDEEYAARQVAHMEAYFRSDKSLFKRITTVPALAKHIAELIIRQLGG